MTSPVTLELRGHGDLIAHNSQELAVYQNMGWVPRPDTPPAYQLFPMYLRGDGLPDLLVENEAEARAATRRGYRLPSDDAVEDGKAAFAQAYEPEDEDYDPAEEIEAIRRGWTIGAAEPLRADVARETRDPTESTSEAEDPIPASPPSMAARKRPSGAQWRKRRREQMQAAQPEGSP
jgi:hypothetical protein